MNGISSGVHCASYRDNSAGAFLKYSFLMSSIVSLSSSPPSSFCDFHSFILNSESWLLQTLITHLSTFLPALSRYNCFPFETFFFFSTEHFFEGPLLMQFPVILLALSLNLNWLRWCSLGLVPRPWLPKPVCDINGPCASSSSLWILLAYAAPWCSLYNSLCGQTVRVNCLWQVVNQYETQKRWGRRW